MVSANSVRSVCSAIATPIAKVVGKRASFTEVSCSLCLRPKKYSRVVLREIGNGSRERWSLENVRQLRGQVRSVNTVKASADDADDVSDEDVIKDMERYLNELSVEYENVWDTKPAWCQPWSIVLTGVTGVSLSWLAIKSTIVTGVVTVLVAGWWYVFLYTYPMAYTAMIAERRRNQRNGTEDTYGLRTRK